MRVKVRWASWPRMRSSRPASKHYEQALHDCRPARSWPGHDGQAAERSLALHQHRPNADRNPRPGEGHSRESEAIFDHSDESVLEALSIQHSGTRKDKEKAGPRIHADGR